MKMTFGDLGRILKRSFRLKCPRCEHGHLFRNYFKMFTQCENCRLTFEREYGYFVGAMYLNYGITVLIAFSCFFFVQWIAPIPFLINLTIWALFSLIFPILFYRYSKSLWLNFDYAISAPDTSEDN